MNDFDSVFQVSIYLADTGDVNFVYGLRVIDSLQERISGKTLAIGVDQSTTQTGLAILNAEDDSLIAVLDLANKGFPSAYEYKQYLRTFIKWNFEDSSIKYFVYEIPLEHANNMYSRRALLALREFISEFPHKIKSLNTGNMFEIVNTTWKGHFLASKEYKGMKRKTEDVKVASMLECIKRFPDFQMYCAAFNAPPDGCDAVGIIYGFLTEIRSSFSRDVRKPNKTMPLKGVKYNALYEVSTVDSLADLLHQRLGGAYERNDYELLEFNPAMSVDENCKRYLGSPRTVTYGVMLVTDAKAGQLIKWEQGIELPTSKHMYVIICYK